MLDKTPKKRGGKRPYKKDPNEIAFSVFQRSIGEAPLLPEDQKKYEEPKPVTMGKASGKREAP